MDIDVRKSSLVVGRRTHINILESKRIRKDEHGGDYFEDYWTDSGEESSHTSTSNKRERLKKSTNLSLSASESDSYDNDEIDKSKKTKKILKKTSAKSAICPELEKCSISDVEENSLATTIDNSKSSKLEKIKKSSGSKSVLNKTDQDQKISNQLPVNDLVLTRNMIRKQQDEKKHVKEVSEKENYSPLNVVNNFKKIGTSCHNEALPKSDKISNTRNFRSKVSQFLNKVAHEELASSTSLSPLSKTYDKKRDISVSPHAVSKRRNYVKNFDLQEKICMQILKDADKEELFVMKSVSPLSKTFDVEKNTLLPNLVSKSNHTEKKSFVVSASKSPVKNAALVKPLEKHQRKTKSALEMEKIISNCDEYDALIMQMINENNESSTKKNSLLEVGHSNGESILSSADEIRPQNEKTKIIDRTARKLDFTKTIEETSKNFPDQTKGKNLRTDSDENISSSEIILNETSKNVSSHLCHSMHNSMISSHRIASNASAISSEKKITLHNPDHLPSPKKRHFPSKYKETENSNDVRVHMSSRKKVSLNSPVKSLTVSKDVEDKDFDDNIDEGIKKSKRVKNNVQDNSSQAGQSSLMSISPKKHNSDNLLQSKKNVRHKKKISSTKSEETKDSNDAKRVHRFHCKEIESNSPVKSINVSEDIEDNDFSDIDERSKKIKHLNNNVQDTSSQAGQSLLMSISPKKHNSDHLSLPEKNVRHEKKHSSTKLKEPEDSNDEKREHRSSRKKVALNSHAKSMNVPEDVEDNDFSDIDKRSEKIKHLNNNVQDTSSQAGQSLLISISPKKHNSDYLSLPEKNARHEKKHSSTKSKEPEDSNNKKREHRSSRKKVALSSPAKPMNVPEDVEDTDSDDNIDEKIEKNKSVENDMHDTSSQAGQPLLMSPVSKRELHNFDHMSLSQKNIRHDKKHSFSKSKKDKNSNKAKRIRRSSRQVTSNSSAESINLSEDMEDSDFRDNVNERIENNKSVQNKGQNTSSQLKQSSIMSISQKTHHSNHPSLPKKNVRHKKKQSSIKSKEIEDSNDANGLRRSGRQRYAPLAHWRNERLCYRFENGQIKILGIDEGTNEDNIASQQLLHVLSRREINHKSKSKAPPKIRKIQLHDTIYDKKVHVKLFKPFGSVEWNKPISAPKTCPYRIKRTFETQNSAFGFLEIDISEIKPPQYMPEEDLQMTLIKGHIEVIIQEASFEAMEKDMFIVPRGSAYSIKNIGNTKAFLTFVVGKFKFLESQD